MIFDVQRRDLVCLCSVFCFLTERKTLTILDLGFKGLKRLKIGHFNRKIGLFTPFLTRVLRTRQGGQFQPILALLGHKIGLFRPFSIEK